MPPLVKNRIESFVVPRFIHYQHPPQKSVERRRYRQDAIVRDMLLSQGYACQALDMHFNPDSPYKVQGTQSQTDGVESMTITFFPRENKGV